MWVHTLGVKVVGAALVSALAWGSSATASTPSQLRLDVQSVQVVAHHGMVGPGAPRDSLHAFKRAAWHHADVIESNVRSSRDGVFYFVHDPTVNADTNGTGTVCGRSSSYLNKLRLANGTPIVQAADVVRYMKSRTGFKFALQIKPDKCWTQTRVQRLIGMFTDAGLGNRLYVSSFSTKLLGWAHAAWPNGYYEWIGSFNSCPSLGHVPSFVPQVNCLYSTALSPYGAYATYIAAAHAHGLAVQVRSTASGVGDNGTEWRKETLRRVKFISVNRLARFNHWRASILN